MSLKIFKVLVLTFIVLTVLYLFFTLGTGIKI